ncbi:xanthine dehydrogenase family protein molybdopterin-binding subunit [Rhodoplanes sp. Z2-YC6860]|uniref:xanthine dehydrogenase family protein molybdopterin-binding subunit n=1 Tax=Rhodoplanes sp. Z2-YC6860 TaxID=674703 RepID=UPI00078B1F2A|nr:xanthine dehydrogenase family protein molybdopterin-binding subunit [Rhodoplanes sp. Z2-YC6860]AMN39881.1 aerobic-type carbon monoxide dehydrogenase, large subunit CoxL/CutL-like protein [Rhodoplanes sp. Z2-YC6860]
MVTTLNPPARNFGSQIGRSVPRLESREKVTGRAEYTHTMRVPGMLHAKLFRSTVAHGRIKSVDVSAAKAMPGVLHVVTIDDVMKVLPNPYYGPAFHDQPILAHQKVRFVGEPVAAVLATDPHVAEQAVQLITAEYEELPAVFDEVEAVTSNVYVHDELKPAKSFADLKHLKGARDTNVALNYKLRRGDFDQAYAAAEFKFEHEFKTQKVLHLPLEPFACICDYRDDHVTFYDSSQGPSFVRIEMARLLGWPENKVRIKVPYLGSGYGGKLYIKLEALALALSMVARKPVKVATTFEEMFYQVTRHPCTYRIKSGVDKNGKIVARRCEVIWNGGAYADIGPRVTQKAGLTASGPYDIDNVSIDSMALYTNLTPAGALRGFGVPQLVWAYESHMDMMAREMKLDPVEFRRTNLVPEGRPHATGQMIKDAPLERILDKVLERMNWSAPFDKGSGTVRRGRGIAIAIKAVTSPTTSVAIVNIAADGSIILYCGTVDMGQGSDTVMAQIAAEVLNVPAETIRVIPRDTDSTPYDMGTLGSRSTFHMGHAVRRAAEDARDKLKGLAKDVGEPEGSNVPIAELFQKRYGMQAGNIIGTGVFKPDYISPNPENGQSTKVTPFWLIAGGGAEVEVDTETGHVKILKLVNVVDCGKAINPKAVETQISGAALMHVGFTMFEKMYIDGGQVTNASLADYKIPGFHDVPDVMDNVAIEHEEEGGPFGAKGVGEVSTFCPSPAIANAIDDAVGVRITEMPLNAETVFRAIRAKNGAPLESE